MGYTTNEGCGLSSPRPTLAGFVTPRASHSNYEQQHLTGTPWCLLSAKCSAGVAYQHHRCIAWPCGQGHLFTVALWFPSELFLGQPRA